MASMLGDTHIKAKWLLSQILFNPVNSPNKLMAGRQRSGDTDATKRPIILKDGQSVKLTTQFPNLVTSELLFLDDLNFLGSESVDGSLNVRYTISSE
jgi:hypothetical protein